MRLYPQLSGPRTSQILRDVLVGLALVLFAFLARLVHEAVMSLTAISEGFANSASGAQDTWNSVGDSLGGIPFVGDEIKGTFQDLASATFGNAAQTGQIVTDAVTTAANVLAFVAFAGPAAVMLVLWLPRRMDKVRRWDAAERVLSAVAVSPGFGYGLAAGPPDGALGAVPGPGVLGSAPGVGAGMPVPTDEPAPGHDTVVLPWSPPPGVPPGTVSFPPDELLALRALCHLPFEDLVRFTPRPFEAFAAGDYKPLVAALYAHEGLIPPGWSTRA